MEAPWISCDSRLLLPSCALAWQWRDQSQRLLRSFLHQQPQTKATVWLAITCKHHSIHSIHSIHSSFNSRMAQVTSHIFQFERMFQIRCCGKRKFPHLKSGWMLLSWRIESPTASPLWNQRINCYDMPENTWACNWTAPDVKALLEAFRNKESDFKKKS